MKNAIVSAFENVSERTMEAFKSKAGPAVSGLYKDTGTRAEGVVHTVQHTDAENARSFQSIATKVPDREISSATLSPQAVDEAGRKADLAHVLNPGSAEAAHATTEYRQAQLSLAKGPHASANRPVVNANDPDPDTQWIADNSRPGRADGIVLSGHGGWDTNTYTRVPAGTRVHFYTQHGQVVPDNLGGDIETGAAHGNSVEQGQSVGSARIFGGGQSIPDYTISPPHGLTIQGSPVIATPQPAGGYRISTNPGVNGSTIRIPSLTDGRVNSHSITFSQDSNLSQILTENMGDVHIAACRFVPSNRPGTRNQGDGLFNP